MGINIRASGRTTKETAKDCFPGPMEIHTTVNGGRVRKMGWALTCEPMATSMSASGRMTRYVEKGSIPW